MSGTTDGPEGGVGPPSRRGTTGARRVRYAVVGLGHIAQNAVLPAFRRARRNSSLVALVSGSAHKREHLRKQYGVPLVASYDGYDDLVRSGVIDAVYIALPNDLHHEYALRAASAGVHVLCEKPLAVTEQECEEMIAVARRHDVRLMTAYRLHFEAATMKTIELVRTGRIGEPRFVHATVSSPVDDPGNIRLSREHGGGPLSDLGIYCINAARSLFRDEPIEVYGMHAASPDPRFREVPEMTMAVMRFPGQRLASFGCILGATETSAVHVVGTLGDLRLEPAFAWSTGLAYRLQVNGTVTRRRYRRRDQFASELLAFSRYVLEEREPEPSGFEGLADVRVIRALDRSAESGCAVTLDAFPGATYPGPSRAIYQPPGHLPGHPPGAHRTAARANGS